MELNEAIDNINLLITNLENMSVKEIEPENYILLNSLNTVLEELNNRIPRKDIEDLKEKIHWELDKNGITRGYQIIIDGYFNKLLNKE